MVEKAQLLENHLKHLTNTKHSWLGKTEILYNLKSLLSLLKWKMKEGNIPLK